MSVTVKAVLIVVKADEARFGILAMKCVRLPLCTVLVTLYGDL